MSGYESKAEAIEVVRSSIETDSAGTGLARDLDLYDMAGIIRDVVVSRGSGYGWGIVGRDEFVQALKLHRRETVRLKGIPVVDAHGATFVPWTNGWAVGFRVTFPDGRPPEYVYLNPSTDSDDGISTVFLYSGLAGDPCEDPDAHCFVELVGQVEP